jgi:CIC family chloride channel protein
MIASAMVRETFGYSFSTWRLHLRGETIRSAHDVSWMRPLSAGRMMRKDVQTVPAETTLAEFRRRFPLGSTKRVIMVDGAGLYAGVIPTATAYAEGGDGERPVAGLAINADAALKPEQSIKDVMRAFDRSETDELAVIDDSHLHAGHAGARAGRHFTVRICSARFAGLNRVARHRLVYHALACWMPRGIHALAIDARAP